MSEWANGRASESAIRRFGVLAAIALTIAACSRPAPAQTPVVTAESTLAVAPVETGSPGAAPALLPAYSVVTMTLLTDPSGFPGSPAVSGEGTIFVSGLTGRLYAVTQSGELLWEAMLPANAAGTPLVAGKVLYALDRAGLNAFTFGGELLWRFEHESGTAIAGPTAGPDGALYYTIQSGSQGHIQAVTDGGEPLWLTPVGTHSYYLPPLPTPNGQLVLFRSEVFSTIDGAPVDLQLDFEPEGFYIGADRQVYLLYQDVLMRWTYADGRAILSEERVISPHELGSPVQVGILDNGDVVFVYPMAVAWFTPAGRMLQVARVEEGVFTHLIDVTGGGLHVVCGRSRTDLRENGAPNCAIFSREYALPLWNRPIRSEEAEFTGGVALPDGAIVALEDGGLYRIEFEGGP